MVTMSNYHPRPQRWISKLKWRKPMKTFSNGSAVGHVRRPEFAILEYRRWALYLAIAVAIAAGTGLTG